ncbi:helix-turn-helix domain-containing protein [Brevundimonas sp.]|uniref:helix-turn-helix domain-containing protein n=1 Tax=Brevundimonas sp. TaxID=1871086 RepID=UPI0025E11BA8|nr:helix-turn-helix domain-containing protein [Brevundimonas sp.]
MAYDCTEVLDRVRSDAAAASLIADLVALATGVSVADITARTKRGRRAVRARRTCMYLAYVSYQWPLERVAAAFGRDRTTVGQACRDIEDLRDDPAFDAELDRLEACLRLVPRDGALREAAI